MTEDEEVLTGEELDGDSGGDDDKIAKILKSVRAENAKRRVQNRELVERIEQLNADYAAALEKAEQLKMQAEQTSSELEKERAERQRAIEITAAANKAVIESLPDRLQKVVPTDYDPFKLRQWLDAAAPVLTQAAPPPMDGEAGTRPDRAGDTVAVDADSAMLAQALGIDPQQLVKEMNKSKR